MSDHPECGLSYEQIQPIANKTNSQKNVFRKAVRVHEELDALRSQFDIQDFGFEQADKAIAGALDDRYSQNIGTVDYRPSDVERDPSELFYQTDRFDDRIEAMDAPEEIKELCRIRAHWFCEFDFAKTADYYCNQATPEVQDMFESLALVLLDRDQMIEKGFSQLVEDIVGDADE